jgi:glycosyltransferase involved in cell wall biosynthesis
VKILYDYQAFTRQFYGGVSRYFVELAKRLSIVEDTEVQILAPLYINHYLKELDSGIVSGRQLSKVPKAAGKLLNIYNRALTRSRAASYRPDILHETYFSKHSVSLQKNQARVVTVYDMIHERSPEYFPAWDKTAENKRLAVERADHVICISENTRRDLLGMIDVRGEKVSVVHLGFDSQQASETPAERLLDEAYLLYVGIRSGYKNFSRLLEAYAGSRALRENYRLVCFGGGDFRHSEIQQIKNLKLSTDKLIWMGGSDKVLMNLYRHATAFVFPSLYEGFGIPPLEAMAHDCPVVCSSGSSISEVVGNAGEYFSPRDSATIAHAIEKVVSSQSRLAELRELGRQRIKRFAWDQCARSTHDIYASLS